MILVSILKELGSICIELDAVERLRIFHDFYRVGEETSFNFDMITNMRKGHSFKDFICPDSMEFESDYFKIGNRYGRVIFALSSNILLYSFLNLSNSSFSIGNSIVSSKSILFNLLLIIVILVVAPVSNEFNNSEEVYNNIS